MEGAFDVAREVSRHRALGNPVSDLSIGEPGFATPAHVVRAATEALGAGDTRYTPPAGLPELRSAIAAAHSSGDTTWVAEQVNVTPGAKAALLYSIIALAEPGSEVLIPDPGFPPYAAMVSLARCRSVRYPLAALSDPDHLESLITPRTRLLVINSPHNPTGTAIDAASLERLVRLAELHDLWIVSDEIYSRIWYGQGDRAPGIADVAGAARRAVVVDGFSKSHAMTGWRLGYCLAPQAVTAQITRIAVNSHSCVAGFVQAGGLAALTGPDTVSPVVSRLQSSEAVLRGGLAGLSDVSALPARGAFYLWADFSAALDGTGLDAAAFADLLLTHHAVACVPGAAFSETDRHHLRLSFAADHETLVTATAAIADALAQLKPTDGSHQ